MSSDSIVLFGCSRSGYLDLTNCLRTNAYVGRLSAQDKNQCCDNFVPFLPVTADAVQYLNNGVYTTPANDNAWWYDPVRPESAGFFGFELLYTSGTHAGVSTRTTSVVSTSSGVTRLIHGPIVDEGYQIVMEGAIRGATCCAVSYGVSALRQRLRGCCGSGGCAGDALRFLDCIPDLVQRGACSAPNDPLYVLPAETSSPWRTIPNTVGNLEVVSTGGSACGSCGCGSDTFVRITFRGGPGKYTDRLPLASATTLVEPGAVACEIVCHDPVCAEPDPFADPLCPAPTMPMPVDAAPDCYCAPMFESRKCYEITTPRGNTFQTELIPTIVTTAAGGVRNVTVRVWHKRFNQPYSPGVYPDCQACAGFSVGYLPPNAEWTYSTCTGEAGKLNGFRVKPSALLDASGQPGGGPFMVPCGDLIVCITADVDNTAGDATLSWQYSQVEP